ncbi:hypothetical protein AAAC51_07505 [Priestia megaterium]
MVAELAQKFNLAYTDITEGYIFTYHKKLKKELMSKVCSNAILTGYKSSNGHTYRTNQDDQLNMIAQKEYINSHPELETVKWKTQDAGYVEHPVEEWVKLYYEGFDYKMGILFKYEKIKKMIELAQNDFELTAIDWDTFESVFPDSNKLEDEVDTPENPTTEEPDDSSSEGSTGTPNEGSTEQPTDSSSEGSTEEPTNDEPTNEETSESTTPETSGEQESLKQLQNQYLLR